MAVIGLSHPRAITAFSDPIHNRIECTLFDRDLIDSRYFQRLHFVLQNSVNYTSFASNKNTRFPHSIGVAHTCGRLFSKGLANSKHEDLESFLDIAADFIEDIVDFLFGSDKQKGLIEDRSQEIDDYIADLNSAHSQTIAGRSDFVHTPYISTIGSERIFTESPCGKSGRLSAIFVIDTLWQSLRLYALMHDLGHLPMSHAFETAIRSIDAKISLHGGSAEVQDNFKCLSEIRKNSFTGHDLESKEESKKFDSEKFQEIVKIFSANKGDLRKFHREAQTPEKQSIDKYFKSVADLIEVDFDAVAESMASKEFHEIRGLSLFNIFMMKFSNPVYSFPKQEDDVDRIAKYSSLINHISLCIIFSKALLHDRKSKSDVHPLSFLYAIRRIVDGEVDGDRMDYTLRDCHEAGSQFGNFDIEKIVCNSILVKGDKEKCYSFGFYYRAISSIEQFYEARYQSYKYIIYHRAAVRSNTCIEALITALFSYSFMYPNTKCADILQRYGYIDKNTEMVFDFLPVYEGGIEKIEDCTLRSLLHDVNELFSDKSNDSYLRESGDDSKHKLALEINNLCQIILYRDFSRIITLFKYETPLSLVNKAIGSDGDHNLRSKFIVQLIKESGEIIDDLRKAMLHLGYEKFKKPITILSNETFAKVFAVPSRYAAFEDAVWLVEPEGAPVRVERRSSALRSMGDRVEGDRAIRVYAIAEDIKKPGNELIKFVENHVTEVVRNRWEAFKEENADSEAA